MFHPVGVVQVLRNRKNPDMLPRSANQSVGSFILLRAREGLQHHNTNATKQKTTPSSQTNTNSPQVSASICLLNVEMLNSTTVHVLTVRAFSNFSFSLQGLQICADGGPSWPSRCISSLAAASGNFVLDGAGTCMQLATASRFLNRWSRHFKPWLASAPNEYANKVVSVEGRPCTKTIHRCCHHCRHHRHCHAAAAVGVGQNLLGKRGKYCKSEDSLNTL